MPNEENTNGTDANKAAKKEMTQPAIEKAMREDGRYNTYFEKYSSSSVESFIKDYTYQKHLWWHYGDGYVKAQENADQHLMDAASRHLEIIQQKKLLMCSASGEQKKLRLMELRSVMILWRGSTM